MHPESGRPATRVLWRDRPSSSGIAKSLARLGRKSGSARALESHKYVDAGDLEAFRRHRQLADNRLGVRNVDERVLTLDEEVVVLGDVGVEIGLRAVHRDLTQQPDLGELMQR